MIRLRAGRLRNWRFDSRHAQETFLFSIASRPAVGIIFPLRGIRGSEREAHNSPVSSAVVNNGWSYTTTPPYISMGCSLFEHMDNSTTFLATLNFRAERLALLLCIRKVPG
jgi:hypothetical protein